MYFKFRIDKKTAMGEWITWLDYNWPVDFPHFQLNRAPPIVYDTQFAHVQLDIHVLDG